MTSKNFLFTSGDFVTNNYGAITDDETTTSGVNGVWYWDLIQTVENAGRYEGTSPDTWCLRYTHSTRSWVAIEPNTSLQYTGTISTSGVVTIVKGSSNLVVFNESAAFSTFPSSGPTVTSITDDTLFVPSDTVSNTDFTLLKNGSAYANTNISLTGPSAQPPSDARGYTYSLTYDGTAYYRATIDSKSYEELYYDNTWTSSPSSGRSTNSNRILNVISTIPTNTSIESGSNSLTSVSSNNGRTITYTYTADLSSINRNANTTIEIIFFTEQRLVNDTQEIVGVFYEIHTENNITTSWQSSAVYIIGSQQSMTYTQNLMGVATTFSVQDWVYSDEPEGDGYVAPVSTTSNGGGKPDRYPLIMTNLFNRNRSLYSIGMTHKDTWDLFL